MSQHDMLYQPVTILEGGTISDVANVFNKTIVGFDLPLGFPATNITFMAKSKIDGEFVPYAFDGTAVSLAAVDGVIGVAPSKFAAVQQLKIVSDTPMTEDTTIYVIARSVS